MINFWEDNADLQFVVEHFIEWDSFTPLVENDFVDAKKYAESKDALYEFAPSTTEEAVTNYRAIWEAYADVIAGELQPHVAELDKVGLKFEDGVVTHPPAQQKFFNTLKQTGILCIGVDRKWGGNNFGQTARLPINEMLSRTDAATQIIFSYYNMAEMISAFGDEQMKQEYLPRFVKGEMLGAMALTEPNVGSDLTHASLKAVRVNDREFELTGTKIFITQGCGFGDSSAAIFTIARSLDRKGALGLSFFLVETKDVEISRLEEKMGLHSSATCEVIYNKSKGILIGEEGAGLVKYAIRMMNGARVGIACQSMGISQAAYSLAKKYASEREQFGVKIEKLAPVARLLDEMQARVQGSRALIYRTSQVVDRYLGLRHMMQEKGLEDRAIRKDPEASRWDKLAKILTPLSKFTASEWSCKVAYDGVQVHGGVGYIEEYEIAKVYRDARITTIYEGTTQLQVVAIIGGIVEGTNEGSLFSDYFLEKLALVKDKTLQGRIRGFWDELIALVTIYKEQDKDEREQVALELCWHLAYMYITLLIARQTDIAEEKQHPILEEKKKVLATMLRLSEFQIAGGSAFVRAVADER